MLGCTYCPLHLFTLGNYILLWQKAIRRPCFVRIRRQALMASIPSHTQYLHESLCSVSLHLAEHSLRYERSCSTTVCCSSPAMKYVFWSIGITYIAVVTVRSRQSSCSLYGEVAPLAVIMGSMRDSAKAWGSQKLGRHFQSKGGYGPLFRRNTRHSFQTVLRSVFLFLLVTRSNETFPFNLWTGLVWCNLETTKFSKDHRTAQLQFLPL